MCARRNIATCLLILLSPVARAQPQWSGFAEVEIRAFTRSPSFEGQHNHPSASLLLQPEFYHGFDNGAFTLIPFARLDQEDDRRSHVDLREALLRTTADAWELRLGIGKVFWGVTESVHLVDVINQTDLVEEPDGEDKLGQPMLHATWFNDWGQLEGFVLPGFRERTFPGRHGRLRPALPIGPARYASSAEDQRIDLALRWSQVLGDIDLGLSHFHGTAREPELRLNPEATLLTPFYPVTHQSGLDLQYTRGAALWKLEALRRDAEWAAVGGFEYTFYGLANSDADLGWLVEYAHDDDQRRAFARDLFSALRLTLNDVQSTELLAGLFYDLDHHSRFASIEASRRIGNRIKISLTARLFDVSAKDDPLFSTRADDYLAFSCAWYF